MAHAAAVGARVEVGAKERQGSSGGVRYHRRQLASGQIICRGEWSKARDSDGKWVVIAGNFVSAAGAIIRAGRV